MTDKLRVMTVVGTRPEIVRLSRVIAALDQHTDHVLVHTGQNYDYELSQVFFDDLGIRKPNHFLSAAGETAAQTVAKTIAGAEAVLLDVRPDAFLVLGDTNSCLAAYPAKRHRVPVFHMEAGNRCFDERVPEEINRRIIDHIADMNLPYTRIAREYLLREGLPPDRIIVTGSPMLEVLTHYRPSIDASDALSRLSLEPGGYFVVSCHREENVDSPAIFPRFVGLLNGLADRFRLPVVLSTHPRTRKRLEAEGAQLRPLVRALAPMGFCDYVKLQMNARAVLSDSGTITEESAILGFPALNMREAHERPEGMEEGAVMMVRPDLERILRALAILEQERPAGVPDGPSRPVSDYTAPNVSQKVVRIIVSYADYVNRTVWRAH